MQQRKEDKRVRRVEEALVAAHLHREETEPGPGFDPGVMQAVRSLRVADRAEAADSQSYERAIWRFATATCMVVAVFLFWFINSDSESAYQIAGLFIEGSMGFDIAESFGIL